MASSITIKQAQATQAEPDYQTSIAVMAAYGKNAARYDAQFIKFSRALQAIRRQIEILDSERTRSHESHESNVLIGAGGTALLGVAAFFTGGLTLIPAVLTGAKTATFTEPNFTPRYREINDRLEHVHQDFQVIVVHLYDNVLPHWIDPNHVRLPIDALKGYNAITDTHKLGSELFAEIDELRKMLKARIEPPAALQSCPSSVTRALRADHLMNSGNRVDVSDL